MSNSLQPYGVWPARPLCPWTSPGKNTGVGSHSLHQGIFPTQGSNPGLPHCRQILYHLSLWTCAQKLINMDWIKWPIFYVTMLILTVLNPPLNILLGPTSNTQKQLGSQLQVQAVVEACPIHLLMGRSSLSHTLWWNVLTQNIPGGLVGKESACKTGDTNSIPGSGRSPGEGNGNPLQYSCHGKIPQTAGPGGLQSIGSQRVGHDWTTKHAHIDMDAGASPTWPNSTRKHVTKFGILLIYSDDFFVKIVKTWSLSTLKTRLKMETSPSF